MGETTIRARISEELKKAFEEACEQNDRTGSQILRDLIKEYVIKNAQGSLLKDKK